MRFFKSLLFVFLALYPVIGVAYQDDARILLRRPVLLFDGNEKGKTLFLTDFAGRSNFGSFLGTDEYHSWLFGTGLDLALLSFSDGAIWRIGLNMDALADAGNEISFRMAQTHYEFTTAFEFKLDESVFYLGWRHRCRHGADNADTRIIMKTGPEIGFNGLNHLGPVDLIWSASLLTYVFGQNQDVSHQHRMNLSGSVQAEYEPWEGIGLFASAGLSALWVTKGEAKDFNLFTTPKDSYFRFSPGASLGVSLKGKVAEFKTYLAYVSNLDTGFTQTAHKVNILSLNGEFWF
jgi:hypothetical protein